MTNHLLNNFIGITETKITIIDILIKFIDRTGSPILKEDLINMKEEIIKQSGREEISEALNLMEQEK